MAKQVFQVLDYLFHFMTAKKLCHCVLLHPKNTREAFPLQSPALRRRNFHSQNRFPDYLVAWQHSQEQPPCNSPVTGAVTKAEDLVFRAERHWERMRE